MADRARVQRMAAEVLDPWGRIYILMNNAGHSSAHRMLHTTTPPRTSAAPSTPTLPSPSTCSQTVMPAMPAAGYGTIMNVSSLAGVTGSPLAGLPNSAATAGVINFTEYLNVEFKNSGLRANVIIPGEVDTPIPDHHPVNPSAEARATMATAEDVVRAISLVADLP